MYRTPTVTGIIERTRLLIDHLLRQDERTNAPMLLLPAPKQQNATAATWERNAPLCEKHGTPHFRSLVTTDTLQFGQYYCSQCEQEKNEATILSLHTGKIHALFPAPGQLARRIHMSEVRHSMQEAAIKDILADIQTNKDLSKTPEASLILQQPHHNTTPLPARDIERAITPPRTALFADVPPVTIWEESDDDATERRKAVRHTPSTVQIPAMSAEVILEALMHGNTHEQSTGENERVPVQADDWLR